MYRFTIKAGKSVIFIYVIILNEAGANSPIKLDSGWEGIVRQGSKHKVSYKYSPLKETKKAEKYGCVFMPFKFGDNVHQT